MTTPSEFPGVVVAFGDPAGLGEWEVSHFRQHLNWNNFFATQATPIIFPTYPIMRLVGADPDEILFWLKFHEQWHEDIRKQTNVSDIDLSEFDITKPDVWYDWQDLHNSEHQLIDQALGFSD